MICEKIAYERHRDAADHIKSLTVKQKGKYATYKCGICGKFHVRTVKKKLQNIEDKYKIDVNELQAQNKQYRKQKKKQITNRNPTLKKNTKSIQTTYKPFAHFKFTD